VVLTVYFTFYVHDRYKEYIIMSREIIVLTIAKFKLIANFII